MIDRRELAARIDALGPLRSYTFVKKLKSDGQPLRMEQVPGQKFAIDVRHPNAQVPYTLTVDVGSVPRLLGHAWDTSPEKFSRVGRIVWVICCLPLGLFVVAAFLTRGGVSFPPGRLALVRADGRCLALPPWPGGP